ncbi:unnamed protein product [Caenorhabditis sp. 36 PRJEB53466]|nr:unnamed protein product [Caenorhabditis sp. 36 PRJEB53466]
MPSAKVFLEISGKKGSEKKEKREKSVEKKVDFDDGMMCRLKLVEDGENDVRKGVRRPRRSFGERKEKGPRGRSANGRKNDGEKKRREARKGSEKRGKSAERKRGQSKDRKRGQSKDRAVKAAERKARKEKKLEEKKARAAEKQATRWVKVPKILKMTTRGPAVATTRIITTTRVVAI